MNRRPRTPNQRPTTSSRPGDGHPDAIDLESDLGGGPAMGVISDS